jgi:hypothetical protein
MRSLYARYLGWPAQSRLAWVLPAIVLVALGVSQTFTRLSFAQNVVNNPAPKDNTPVDMTRGQWRERVLEAKRRARQFAQEHRGRPSFDPPSLADEERIASERALNDDDLQRGDIVSTNKGLFVFKGQSDQERRESDFVPLPRR